VEDMELLQVLLGLDQPFCNSFMTVPTASPSWHRATLIEMYLKKVVAGEIGSGEGLRARGKLFFYDLRIIFVQSPRDCALSRRFSPDPPEMEKIRC